MGSRDRRKRQAKKIANSLVVWFGNKPYVWSRKYGTFINWFRLKTGEIRGEKLEDAKRRNNEQAAQTVGGWVDEDNDPNPTRIGPSNLSRAAIIHNELVEEMRIMPRLRADNRQILPDRVGVAHRVVYDEADLPTIGDCPYQTIDLLTHDGVRKKRRFYGANREIVQENHYEHKDRTGTHIFPHVHIVIDGEWSLPIQYSDKSSIRYHKANTMDDRFNKVTQEEVDEANRFYDRILDWRKRNGVSQKVIRSISENRDRKASISTVFAVQILISNGRELEASYNGYDGDICCNAGFYYVAVEKNGEKFIYSTSDLDDFGKNAKFGPYPLKDVVDKWDVHFA